MDPYLKAKRGFQVFINAFTSGSWTLAESDPVWCVLFLFFGGEGCFWIDDGIVHKWRNAVGIGIFIVVCVFFLLL